MADSRSPGPRLLGTAHTGPTSGTRSSCPSCSTTTASSGGRPTAPRTPPRAGRRREKDAGRLHPAALGPRCRQGGPGIRRPLREGAARPAGLTRLVLPRSPRAPNGTRNRRLRLGSGRAGMAKTLIADALRAETGPLPPAPLTVPRPKAGRPPMPDRAVAAGGAHRRPLRPAIRHTLGDAAAREGLRVRDDLLAPAARRAERGGLGAAAPGAARPPRPGVPPPPAGRAARPAAPPWQRIGGGATGPSPTRGR
jgi:hypothetical protein